jgi:hypothetical protein
MQPTSAASVENTLIGKPLIQVRPNPTIKGPQALFRVAPASASSPTPAPLLQNPRRLTDVHRPPK